jgi:hypothetical protein
MVKFAKQRYNLSVSQKGPEMRKFAVFLLHALVGWALCGAVMLVGMRLLSLQNALLLHLFAAPLIFALLSLSYHKKEPSARPLLVAAGFTVIVMAMDFFLVAMVIQKSFSMFNPAGISRRFRPRTGRRHDSDSHRRSGRDPDHPACVALS